MLVVVRRAVATVHVFKFVIPRALNSSTAGSVGLSDWLAGKEAYLLYRMRTEESGAIEVNEVSWIARTPDFGFPSDN